MMVALPALLVSAEVGDAAALLLTMVALPALLLAKETGAAGQELRAIEKTIVAVDDGRAAGRGGVAEPVKPLFRLKMVALPAVLGVEKTGEFRRNCRAKSGRRR